MVSFARVPPRRRRSPDGSDGCASLAFSMPLGLASGLISGRPGPPFSRAISSRSAATSRRSSAPSSKSFNTKLLSSAGESASMSGGDIPPSSQKTDDSGILPSPHESIRRTYRPTPSQRSPGLLPLLRSWGLTPCETGAFAMSDKPISPLRQRMIDDMTARRFTEDTQRDYVRHVRTFAAFLGRSPDTATREDLRRFQLHMAQPPISAGSINAAIAALRFFFNVTLERPDLVRHLTTVNKPRKAPVVLSQDEGARLLEAAPGLKYKAALSVAYGAGLRVSEVAALKVSDIDSQRMTLRVEQGKGQRDRY